jgi:hypothetical protein
MRLSIFALECTAATGHADNAVVDLEDARKSYAIFSARRRTLRSVFATALAYLSRYTHRVSNRRAAGSLHGSWVPTTRGVPVRPDRIRIISTGLFVPNPRWSHG